MLRHDPYEPITRMEMADRWQQAERARLRREARAQGRADEEAQQSFQATAGWLRRLVSLLGSRTAPAAPK